MEVCGQVGGEHVDGNFVGPLEFELTCPHAQILNYSPCVLLVAYNDSSNIVCHIEHVLHRLGHNKRVSNFLFRADDNRVLAPDRDRSLPKALGSFVRVLNLVDSAISCKNLQDLVLAHLLF